jgi:hypothetical protein
MKTFGLEDLQSGKGPENITIHKLVGANFSEVRYCKSLSAVSQTESEFAFKFLNSALSMPS